MRILPHIRHNARKNGPLPATTQCQPGLRTLTSTAHHPKIVKLPHALTTRQANKTDHTPATPLLTGLLRAPPLPLCPALYSNDELPPITYPPGQRQEGSRQDGVMRRVPLPQYIRSSDEEKPCTLQSLIHRHLTSGQME